MGGVAIDENAQVMQEGFAFVGAGFEPRALWVPACIYASDAFARHTAWHNAWGNAWPESL